MAVRTRAELEALRDAFETGNPSNITAAKLRDFLSDVFDTLFTAGGAGIATDQIAALQAFVDSRISDTSGEGSKVFVVTATYNATSGVLQFGAFRGSTPSAISVGDVVVFISPSNIDDDQDITVDDGVNSSNRNLFDIDANVVQGRQLSPGRLYWAQRLFEGLFEAYHLALPLGVYQITVPHTVTVNVTNAQLKAIDQAPVELIPAPGAGKAIEIMSVSRTPSGADRPDISDTQPHGTPDSADNQQSRLPTVWLRHGRQQSIALCVSRQPPTSSDGMDVVSDGHFTGTLYAEDQKFFEIIGHQFLQENEAFVLAFAMNSARIFC